MKTIPLVLLLVLHCLSSSAQDCTVVIQGPDPATVICGGTLPTVTIGPVNGGPFTITWNGPGGFTATGQNPAVTAPGIYTVTVNGTNCDGPVSSSIGVNINPAVTPTLISTNAPQTGQYNGVTTFMVCGQIQSFNFGFQGSTAPTNGATHTISWGNGAPNSTFNTSTWTVPPLTYSIGISQGAYTIALPNGCTRTTPFYVFVGDVPLGGLAVTTPSICTGASIDFSWTNFQNNSPGTNYIIDYGDGTTDTFVHPPPATFSHMYTQSSCTQANGEFSVNWEISNPCDIRTGTINQIRVSEQPLAAFAILPNDTVCSNTPVTITDESLGMQAPQCNAPSHIWTIAPATYTLQVGALGTTNGFPTQPGLWGSGSASITVLFNNPGTYTITDLVGNACGTHQTSRIVCVETPPVPNFSLAPITGCSPLTTTTTNSSQENSCSILRTWQATQLVPSCPPEPGTITFNPQQAQPQFNFNGPGTYQVTLTLENSCGQYTHTVQPITVNGPPSIALGTLPIICAGQGCVSPAATYADCDAPITSYTWTSPGGTPTGSTQAAPGEICYTIPGNYTITASATNACGPGSASTAVVVSTIPTANAGADVAICENSSTVLNGSATGGTGPYTYVWTPVTGLSNSNIAGPTASPAITTTYTLTVADAGGCVSTDQLIITVTPAATANAGGPYATCGVQPVAINAIANGPGIWSAPNGTGSFADADSPSTTFIPATTAPPSITLTWTTVDPDGQGPCTDAANTAMLQVNTPASAAITGPYIACSGTPVTIESVTDHNGTWTTSGTGGFSNNAIAVTEYTPGPADAGGTVTITWTTIDPDGPCPSVYASTTMTVSEAALADAGGPYITCGSSPVALMAITSGSGTWTAPVGSGSFADVASSSTVFTPAANAPSSITLTWTTADPDGAGPCTSITSDAILTLEPPATATINGPYSGCSNAPVPIEANTNTAGIWSTTGSGSFGNAGQSSTTYISGPTDGGNDLTITWTTDDPDGSGPCVPVSANTTITIHAAPVVSAGPDETACLDGPALTVEGTPAGGTWSGSGVTPGGVFTPTTTTSELTYVYTDDNGCSNSDEMTVTVNDAAIADAGGPYLTCGLQPIALSATANGNGEWSGGDGEFTDATSPTTAYTPAATEIGTTTILTWNTFDPDGPGPCTGASDIAQLTISTPATADPGGPYTICSSDVANISVTTPGPGSWAGGMGGIGSTTGAATTYTPAVAEAGTTVQLVWTTEDPDGNGPCEQVSAIVLVHVLEAAIADASGPYDTCADTPIEVQATANGSGSWYMVPALSGIFSDPAGTNTTFTPMVDLSAGAVVELVWVTEDPDGAGPCLAAQDTTLLVIHPLPVADAGADLTLGCGDEIIGSATGGAGVGYAFSWSPTVGLIDPGNAITPVTGSGTYILEVTDGNGCTDSDDVTITVTGLEDMAQASDVQTCLFQSVTLSGNAIEGLAPHTFVWSPAQQLVPPSGTGQLVEFLYTDPLAEDSAFTLTLTVVDAYGCADTQDISVLVHPLPVVHAGPDTTLCAYASPFELQGFSPQPTPGTTGGWTPGSSVDPALLPIGNSTFTYSFTDQNSCTNSDALIVAVNEVPVASIGVPDTVCINTTVTFQNLTSCPSCGQLSYSWNFGDGSDLSISTSPQHSFDNTGTYTVTLIAGSGSGCTDTITTTVHVIELPTLEFSFSPAVGCGPLEVDLTNTSYGSPIQYAWSIATFGSSSLPDPGPITFPVAPCDSIFHTLQLTVFNQCGAISHKDSVLVYRPPMPEFVVSSNTICSDMELQIYNTTTCAWQTTYDWELGDGAVSESQGPLLSHTYLAEEDFATYILTLNATNFCGSVSSEQPITVVPNEIIAFFSADPIVGCEPLPVQFDQQMSGVTYFS